MRNLQIFRMPNSTTTLKCFKENQPELKYVLWLDISQNKIRLLYPKHSKLIIVHIYNRCLCVNVWKKQMHTFNNFSRDFWRHFSTCQLPLVMYIVILKYFSGYSFSCKIQINNHLFSESYITKFNRFSLLILRSVLGSID